MRRFRFRLERLLEIRSYWERQWLAKLAAASGHCIRLSRTITQKGEAARGAFFTNIRKGRELDLSLLTYREHYIKGSMRRNPCQSWLLAADILPQRGSSSPAGP